MQAPQTSSRQLQSQATGATFLPSVVTACAAIRCNNLPVLAYKISRLLDDPPRLEAMRSNVRRLARPRAAFQVVETLRELRQRPLPPPPHLPSLEERREAAASAPWRVGSPAMLPDVNDV